MATSCIYLWRFYNLERANLNRKNCPVTLWRNKRGKLFEKTFHQLLLLLLLVVVIFKWPATQKEIASPLFLSLMTSPKKWELQWKTTLMKHNYKDSKRKTLPYWDISFEMQLIFKQQHKQTLECPVEGFFPESDEAVIYKLSNQSQRMSM